MSNDLTDEKLDELERNVCAGDGLSQAIAEIVIAALRAARAEKERLRAALRPFGRIKSRRLSDCLLFVDAIRFNDGSVVTAVELDAAAAALKGETP